MSSTILLGFYILFTASAESINWRDSGSTYKVEDVRVSTCTVKSCTIQKGQEYNIDIVFTATTFAANLPFKITGSKYGFTLPLLDGDLCDGDNPNGKIVIGNCPVSAGEQITYTYVVKVPDFIPSISGTVNARVYNGEIGNNNVLIQGSVDIQVSKTSSSFDFLNGLSFFKNFRTRNAK